MADYDVFDFINRHLSSGNVVPYDVIDIACGEFSENDTEKLANLLRSDNPFAKRTGLAILIKVRPIPVGILDVVLDSISVEDPMARSMAMDILIDNTVKLNYSQVSKVLTLTEDSSDVVLEKVIAFIAFTEEDILRLAVSNSEEEIRSITLNSLSALGQTPEDVDVEFNTAIDVRSVSNTFKLANLERLAALGLLKSPPKYTGSNYIGIAVAENIARIIRRLDWILKNRN